MKYDCARKAEGLDLKALFFWSSRFEKQVLIKCVFH
jgi:hypothetical protein